MNMIEIRCRLHELADQHNIPELHTLADETKRRRTNRRAPRESSAVTKWMALSVKVYAKLHPNKSFQSIGNVFNINGGRVSEIINGKRK